MYKHRIIETLSLIGLNIILALINYFIQSEALKSIMVISVCIVLLYVLYWLYELTKYALFSLIFGNYKRSKTINKIVSLAVCIILFIFTIFVYLIEYPKYVYLKDKLCEKLSLSNVSILNRKTGDSVSYKDYDFSKDKYFTIFIVEVKNNIRSKKYIIYKTDPRYLLLKTYAEIYQYKGHDNDMAFNYLALSYEAILYYKKEIKEIRNNYNKKVVEYKKVLKSGNDDNTIKALVDITEYLKKTKLNNMHYNEIVRQMRLKSTYEEINEMNLWHNFFKNESDKELTRVINELNKCNLDFQNNILAKYQENKEVLDKVKNEVNENN